MLCSACLHSILPAFPGVSTFSPAIRTEDGPELFSADESRLWSLITPVDPPLVSINVAIAINYSSLFRIAVVMSEGDLTRRLLL